MPFEQIGSPWLDHEAAARLLQNLGLPGVAFEPVIFSPTRQPFHGVAPKFAEMGLRGVRLAIQDRARFAPVQAAVSILCAVNRLHPDRLEWDKAAFARLAATTRLRTMILGGIHPTQIARSWQGEVREFADRSQKYWLYQ